MKSIIQKFFILLLFLNSILSFGQSDSLINIMDFDVADFISSYNFTRNYDPQNLDQMLELYEANNDSIKRIFNNIQVQFDKDTCLTVKVRNKLVTLLDSLENTFNVYLVIMQEVEQNSYRDGKMAGIKSLDFSLMLQKQFLIYLKYIVPLYYYAYLEPNVYPCE